VKPLILPTTTLMPARGSNIKQEMDVIRQHFHFNHRVAEFGLFGKHEFFHPSGYCIGQHLAAILQAEDDVVLTTVHDAVVSMVGFGRLGSSIYRP
jgi:hypothetical protein